MMNDDPHSTLHCVNLQSLSWNLPTNSQKCNFENFSQNRTDDCKTNFLFEKKHSRWKKKRLWPKTNRDNIIEHIKAELQGVMGKSRCFSFWSRLSVISGLFHISSGQRLHGLIGRAVKHISRWKRNDYQVYLAMVMAPGLGNVFRSLSTRSISWSISVALLTWCGKGQSSIPVPISCNHS